MNAKIYQDGSRVIVSFECTSDAEELLESIVKVLSSTVEDVTIDTVPALDAPVETEENFDNVIDEAQSDEIKELEIDDFEGAFAGQTPEDIMKAPKCEGFYFLCSAIRDNKIPTRYENEVKYVLASFIDKKGVLKPPYGNVSRMQGYCKMAQNVLGKDEIPDYAYESDDAEWLNLACHNACELLQEFYQKRLK